MKTLNEINELNELYSKTYNINLKETKQGSEEWLKAKLGVISASNASKVVAKKDSETRNTYMCELVAQVCTGEQEELNNKYVDWGKAYEAPARSSYEFQESLIIKEVPFVFLDSSFREGCSPDGIIESLNRGIEIKCPFNAVHFIKFLVDDKIKPEYVWQYQYQMRVMGCDTFDFVQYYPNMKKNQLKVLTVERDEEKQKTLSDAVPQFIHDMDLMLKKIGVAFGEQWK